MNTALLPVVAAQFFDSNGVVLAGGFLYTYAAGTTTPLATYQDSLGVTPNTNPIVLDAGGRANVWLAALTYKIVAQNSGHVVLWTQDNVSAVSLAELTANSSFSSITVSGNATIGGALTVNGEVTAASGEYTGTLRVDGALTATTAAVSGDMSVGGGITTGTLEVTGNALVDTNLTVTGETDLNGAIDIAGVPLATYIVSLVPTLTALSGSLIIPTISVSGGWVIFTFGGGASGSGVPFTKIAWGAGQGGNAFVIVPPTGFNTSNFKASASFATVSATPGNELLNIATSVSVATITVTASDTLGHNFTPTASWTAIAWITGTS